jgi:four helix bundle protein
MHIYSFEKLEVWQLARQFRKEVYIITKSFPSDERFGLTSQLRRAASSIGDNLAEGTGKLTAKDKAKYTTIAFGSAMETLNHLIGSLDLSYLKEEDYRSLREKLEVITRSLTKLYSSQLNGTVKGLVK